MSWGILGGMIATVLTILDTILPVFVVAGMGFLFAKRVLDRMPVEGACSGATARSVRQGLHALTFSFAGPAFVFAAIRESEVAFEALGAPALMAAILYVLLAVVAVIVTAAARWPGGQRKAAILALASKNCGNYGLPVILFAFGEQALVIGTVFMIVHVLVHMTLGLSIASWSEEHHWLRRWTNVLRFPYIYAIGAALLARAVGVSLPAAIERPIALVGQAWIPLMLILLGVELAGMKVTRVWRPAALLAAVKLVVPPLLAYGVTALLGIDGTLRAVLIVQSSMPTAVNGLLVARACNARPDIVAGTLMLSTGGSLVTIAILLALLA